MKRSVLIIGGGASGLSAAIHAAREGASVTVLEHMDRVGKKILSTGNGRCNLANLSVLPEHYRCGCPAFPMEVLDRFSVWDTLRFFDSIGVVTKNKNGYIYPNSDQAAAVLDALRMETTRLGVSTVVKCEPERAAKAEGGRFAVQTNLGTFEGDRLILAAGSKAAKYTGSDGSGYVLARAFGHRVIRPLPALVQLRCPDSCFKQMAGVRCEAVIRLVSAGRLLAADEGELQLTDYGLSGIPTFQVSRFAAAALAEGKRVRAVIDFFPSESMEETRQFLNGRARSFADRKAGDFLIGMLNRKLAAVLLKRAGIGLEERTGGISEGKLEKLLHEIKEFTAEVKATNSFDQAQVCCGGVDTAEICAHTMESKLVPGLHIVGELLDVDGICGGYNLQWAWSSGAVAGQCAARGGRPRRETGEKSDDTGQSGKASCWS